MKQSTKAQRWVWRAGVVVALGLTATACDGLLDIEIPGSITEDATFVPSQATLLVSSAIADIECSLSDFTAFEAAGFEDNTTRTVGWWGSRFERPVTPNTGNCSTGETSVGWFHPLQSGRWMAEETYRRLENDWDAGQVPDREKLMAEAAIYAGIAYTQLGEFFCEVMADGGPKLTWQESLQTGEQWFTDALTHITAAGGDFAMPADIGGSAQQMAYLLRARARWAQNTAATDAAAVSDAQMITEGFASYVTRESGGERTRWNRVYSAHVGLGWVVLLGPVTWWTGTTSTQPAFLGGTAWPATIPFTGYWDLAVLPDGRAVSDAGFPITTADAGAVADPRVPEQISAVTGVGGGTGPNNYTGHEEQKYTAAGDDIPLAKWEEAWLIRAQIEGGQTAIDLVNDIRDAHSLPQVTYLTGASPANDILKMVLEEVRRTHFLEPGRWWSHKLRYDLWFPRGEDQDIWNFGYQTGVRMVYPNGEYTTNANLTDADQGSGCAPNQNPVV